MNGSKRTSDNFFREEVLDMFEKLYHETKGYKTLAGFVVAFIVGGLVATDSVTREQGEMLTMFATMLISFGLGDKIGRKLG